MVWPSDANIQTVVTRVLGVRLCFAQHTAGAKYANIPRVATAWFSVTCVCRCGWKGWKGLGIV
jgi:hypothetical protein